MPLYNDAASIESCLEALLAQTCAADLEIIVVDDGSTDAGPARASSYPIRLIRQRNAGPAAARNAGARAAKGAILIFLDADCIAPRDWAVRVLLQFEDAQVGAVTGAITPAEPHIMAKLIQLEIDERYAKLEKSLAVDFFASVAVAIRSELFHAVGGFREDFRYNEDVELAYRLNALSTKIIFVAEPRVAHFHPTGWRNYFWMKFWRGVWRMRLYRLFPKKAVSDSWTPQTLKFQTLAALATFPVMIAALFYPSLGFLAIGLVLAILLSGSQFVKSAQGRGGAVLAVWSTGFLLVRAVALASSVAWHVFTQRNWIRRELKQ